MLCVFGQEHASTTRGGRCYSNRHRTCEFNDWVCARSAHNTHVLPVSAAADSSNRKMSACMPAPEQKEAKVQCGTSICRHSHQAGLGAYWHCCRAVSLPVQRTPPHAMRPVPSPKAAFGTHNRWCSASAAIGGSKQAG